MKLLFNHLRGLIIIIILIFLIINPVIGSAAQVHRVKSGENLYDIALQYRVTLREIINTNNLRNPENIFAKQVLIIPDSENTYTYRVKKGDTLFKISQKVDRSMARIIKYNGLQNADEIYVRQPLYIPPKPQPPQTYKVKSGDSLYKISKKFETSISKLMEKNNLTKKNNLKVGQILEIPKKTAPRKPNYSGPNYLKLYPNTFHLKGSTNDYKIALTFDDGPDGVYTPQILDVLKKYQVPATFFLMGKRIEKHPEVVKRIKKEGHIIANHTFTHANLAKISEEQFYSEIQKTESSIKQITGLNTSLLRPPYGALSVNIMDKIKNMGYKTIFWSVDTRDWYAQDVNQILINTLPEVKQDSIILFHSAGGGKGHDLSASVKVLPELIQTLRMVGYEFVNIDELININSYY